MLVTIFTVAAILMSFEEVRDVGRSLLASAGIAGLVIGFAAQRSLGNLFAGMQIALTCVVVCVWDQRRIVLPISYFIEKPSQNWTRVPTNMLSPFVMRFDLSQPLEVQAAREGDRFRAAEFSVGAAEVAPRATRAGIVAAKRGGGRRRRAPTRERDRRVER